MLDSLIVLPLGDLPSSEVRAAVAQHFPDRPVTLLDRRALRRRPWLGLMNHRSDAVLVAPDLTQSRLLLTSLALALLRADRHWCLDLHGRRESFSLPGHLRRNAAILVRHLLACALALAFAYPILLLLSAVVRPRRLRLHAPTRILYLRSQLWLGLAGGGSVAHTAGVIGGLQACHVEVHVLSSDRLPGVSAPVRVQSPISWFDGLLREAEELAYNVSFLLAAYRLSRAIRPRAIYQRHTAFNCSGAVLSRVLRIPLVLEFNSSEVWKGRHWGGLRLIRIATLVERINLRAADRIVVVSKPLRRQVLGLGVPAEKMLVNPNAVDPAHFDPTATSAPIRADFGLADHPVVAFSGTFGLWHGIPTLAAALPLVLAARPAARFLLLGDGPLRSTIDDAVQRHALGSSVIMPGLIPHAEVPSYLAASDILLSPHGKQADGGEFFGSPTKLYEYMAAGRAVVASAVGQIAEVLEHERTALLVPPEDAQALADAIVRLIDDGCLRRRLGEAARQQAVACHTWQRNAERLLAALDAP